MLAWEPADGEKMKTMKVGNCNELCPLKDYLEIVKDNIARDEDLAFLNDKMSNKTFVQV